VTCACTISPPPYPIITSLSPLYMPHVSRKESVLMHEHNLLHRDVKPGNVMLDSRSGASKLTDWIGSWAEKESLMLGKPVGAPVFMAPEVAGKPHKHQIVSDTWSLGCTVLNMASGRLPWADTDPLGRTNEFMAGEGGSKTRKRWSISRRKPTKLSK
jgi:serine/threonine protein kinase